MASTSSSPHPYQPYTIQYQVFLSFRGEDTRHSFTDHLYKSLIQAGIRTFRDTDDIERGQQLKPEIETAIIRSKASVVVLSNNYANSRWCLNELSLILEQRRKCGHFVLPVFYHVDPSNVRHRTGSFGIDGMKGTDDDVSRWTAALTEVANLSGMVLSGSETNFITEVVDTVQCKLDSKFLSTPAHLIGMESRVKAIESWLRNEQSNAIAICGMGGSGKTTLAQYIYNLNKQYFESSSFLEEIGKHYKYGLLELQKQLLRDVSGGKEKTISGVSEATRKIEEVLQMKKLLIVLDDIDDLDELSTLLGTKAFPTQSKIIITTRRRDIQAWFGSISWRCWVQELNLLDERESIELLSLHAFGSSIPMKGFEELVVQLAQYCGGNPLALRVLGSSLFVSDEDPHKRNSMIEMWRERMNSLSSFKGDLDCKIQDVLRKSFDSLPLKSHKELFLDIACFFVGESRDMVTMLEDELHAKSGITTLINRCLLTVSHDTGKLMMHQLLQDMGRRIVCEESKHPNKRSRVWNDDEAYEMMRKGYVSDTIEGLALNMYKVKKKMGSDKTLAIKTSSLEKMHKLKLLQLKSGTLTGSCKNFPDLRWLCWNGCPLKTMLPGLLPSSLVTIDMSYGRIKTFEAPTVLHSLKYLRLEGCFQLVSICNFHRLPKLETLILRKCGSLTHLCSSIQYLENLAHLDLMFCTKLWKASYSETYLNQPERLKALRIGEGTPEQPLVSLPNLLMVLAPTYCRLGYKYNSDIHVVFRNQRLYKLCLWGNPYEYVSNQIDLKMLQILHLYFCENLKSLLCMPSTLVELKLYWCPSLERITFQSGRFDLQIFDYERCFKLSEIQGLFKLVPVRELDEADLGHMKWIKAYADHEVDLVGDAITKYRIWRTQILYEYGIVSTYLHGIKDQSMTEYTYMSSSAALSFCVHLNQNKHKIRGLNVSCLYKLSGSKGKDLSGLLAKISNRTKGLTWIYNPVVYCKPRVDEDVVWLSYWPIGNTLDTGDEVHVAIIVDGQEMVVSECGASLAYMDDGEVEKEEKSEINKMKGEEVIGGDLSQFEVTAGRYYLCRRDLFKSQTSTWLNWLFGDNIHYPESLGWRKSRQTWMRTPTEFDGLKKIVLQVSFFNSVNEIGKALSRLVGAEYVCVNEIEKALSRLVGAEYVCIEVDNKTARLIVVGDVDPILLLSRIQKNVTAEKFRVSWGPY